MTRIGATKNTNTAAQNATWKYRPMYGASLPIRMNSTRTCVRPKWPCACTHCRCRRDRNASDGRRQRKLDRGFGLNGRRSYLPERWCSLHSSMASPSRAALSSCPWSCSAAGCFAPYFGGSIHVWGSIITVFMASLALGYLLGGRWSLSNPSLFRFGVHLCGRCRPALSAGLFQRTPPWLGYSTASTTRATAPWLPRACCSCRRR